MPNQDKLERLKRLLPGGDPRYVRVYDNGGGFELYCRRCHEFFDKPEDSAGKPQCPACKWNRVVAAPKGSFDRYTVVYSGNYPGRDGLCFYRGMSCHPTHPQGYGISETSRTVIDAPSGFTPNIGDLSPFGARRIPFRKLPKECQEVVMSDYKALWKLE